MKTNVLILLLALTISSMVPRINAQGAAFTYQGRLAEHGDKARDHHRPGHQRPEPADGYFDLRFQIFDALSDGHPVGLTVSSSDVPVNDGWFAVTIDPGPGVFDGGDRWLEIGVRAKGERDFTTLSPRQKITAIPYAIAASTLTGPLPRGGLSGTYDSAVTLNNSANVIRGTFTGDGAGLTNLNIGALGVWRLGGNAGTTPEMNFLGTTDGQPLEFRVNGFRALRIQPSPYSEVNAPNLIGGASINFIAPAASASVIAGGGLDNPNAGVLQSNSISTSFATISGGTRNAILSEGLWSTIGGGNGNTIQGQSSVISGGKGNTCRMGVGAAIGGGEDNTIQTLGESSTIGGGKDNSIGAGLSVIGGGWHNSVQGAKSAVGGGEDNTIMATFGSVIAGGCRNRIENYAFLCTISGGNANTIEGLSPDDYTTRNAASTIAGGDGNSIGSDADHSTIGGGYANVIQPGAYSSTLVGGASNTVATPLSAVGGGVGNIVRGSMGTVPGGRHNTAGGRLSFAAGHRAQAVHEGAFVWADATDANVASTAPNQFTVRASGGVTFFSDPGAAVGVQLAAGGNSWAPASARHLKENFQSIHPRELLSRVVALPILSYNMKTQDPSIRHVGPTAQDFYAAFHFGEDDKHIATVDADGVALAAIQGLHEIVQEKDALIRAQQTQLDALAARIDALERLIVRRTTNEF